MREPSRRRVSLGGFAPKVGANPTHSLDLADVMPPRSKTVSSVVKNS